MFKYWSLLLSHESWSKSCERRSSELVAFITTLMGCRETIFVDESTINFPIFLHFLIQSFLFFLFSQSWVSYFPFFWASWHWTPCKHSISVVHIFHVISFKAFCKFLRLRNLAWDFLGVNFCSRDFLGGFVGSLRDFFGFWCLPPFNHPHHLKSRVSPALGGGRAYSQEALVWILQIYMHGLWGGHLFGGGGLLEHEFILGNTVIALNVAMWISNSCTWYIKTVLSYIPS